MLCDDLEGKDGGLGGRLMRKGDKYIYIYSYDRFSMLYSRDQHNIVKQLSSN